MKHKGMTNKVISLILTVALFVMSFFIFDVNNIFFGYAASADANTETQKEIQNDFSISPECMDVRIGLEGQYGKKKVLTIYNKSLYMGFSRNDSYKAEIRIDSNSGFSFEPMNGTYYMSNAFFVDYKSVLSFYNSAKAINKSGIYICFFGRNSWRLLISEKAYKAKAEEFDKLLGNGSKLITENSSEFVKLSFGKSIIVLDGNGPNGYPQFSSISSKGKNASVSMGSRSYRGRIEIGRYGKTSVTAVNIVNAEAYLKGVITSEMSSSWHEEALKAQAVVSRSYLLSNNSTGADCNISKPYNLVDTDASQVYKGVSGESANGIAAVNSTFGVVIRAEGKILPAYYFSTSGGATEFSADVWGGNSNHFIPVFDEYETNPERQPWIVKTTYAELKSKLVNAGYEVGDIGDIYVEIMSDSDRVSSVKIKHSKGKFSISGGKLRNLMGMHSTKFKIVTKERPDNRIFVMSDISKEDKNTGDIYCISGTGQISQIAEQTTQVVAISDKNMYNYNITIPEDNEIYFLGMGWGHGIGMSQSGAYGMAMAGYNFISIVEYYYNDVDLVRMY